MSRDESRTVGRVWHRSKSSRPLEDRFWDRVTKTEGCWLWTGYVKNSGYGSFAPIRGKTFMAHRFSYELHHGQVPDGMVVMHTCDVKRCVRPDHLKVGTARDNVHDMMAKGRARMGHYRRKRAA